MKKFFFYILLIFVILKIQVLTVGCANMMPPEGGLRDSLPPGLIKATPADSSNQFTETTINFVFDEFVELTNPQSILITPVPLQPPAISSKLRTVTVKLKDTLEPNTTYTINFGNAIKDINEGNILKGFTYIFATGAVFDSLTLSGNVILAENGKTDTTLIVMLHKNGDDSAVVKEKPRYVTRLDNLGNFTFRNLPPGEFYLYALKDESGTYRYFGGKTLFAFADSVVDTRSSNEPITLYAYAEKESGPLLSQLNIRPNRGNVDKRLRPVINTANGQLDLLNDLVISFDQPLKTLDTSKIQFSTDSSYTPVSGYRVELDSTKKKLSLKYNWKANTPYHIIVDKDFAEDTLGRKLLKTDTLSFRTKSLDEYGSLRIRLKNLDLSQNPVLLFVQNESIVRSVPLTSSELSIALFMPGEYELRILKDRNKNGKWDPGEFFDKHLQPEIVTPIERRITVKSRWQNEFDIAL